MEFGTSIIGLVAVALCTVPVVLMRRSKNKKEKELINGLRSVADAYNCELASWDCGIEFAIGISAAKNHIFFYKKRNEAITEEGVPLKALKKCQVDIDKRTIKTKDGNETVIDKLELTFIPKDTSITPTRFEIFNSDEHFQMNGELPLIRKWEAIINELLKDSYQ